jgi:hypothetical protein
MKGRECCYTKSGARAIQTRTIVPQTLFGVLPSLFADWIEYNPCEVTVKTPKKRV